MADRDDPGQLPLPTAKVPSNVTSIAERLRRRESQRALDRAREALADRTWMSQARADLAEQALLLEEMDIDGALPAGDTPEDRERRAILFCVRGSRYHLRGDAENALADWTRAIEIAPERADPYIMRGAVRAARGEMEAALADLDRATELAPGDASAFYRRGELFSLQGDHERALANFRRAQQLAPSLLSNLSAMANSYVALDDRRGAIAALDRAIKAAPGFADLHFRRALCHAGLGNKNAALRDYDRSLELNPNQATILRLRAYLLEERDLYPQAIADLERACALDPDEIENRRALVRARVYAHPEEASVEEISAVIEVCPEEDYFYGLRARAHQRAGDVAAAIADFETAARLDPDCALYGLGLCELRGHLESPEAALRLVDQLLALVPDDPVLHFSRGKLHLRAGKLDDALRDFDGALARDPGAASVHHERGLALYRMGDVAGAAAAMARAAELEPADGLHLAWRGRFLVDLEDRRDEAGADLDRAVALSPGSAIPWFYRGILRDAQDRLTEALDDFENAIALEPGWPVLFYRRGTCLRDLGNKIVDDCEDWPTDEEEARSREATRAAVADFERAVELGLADVEVYQDLCFARSALDDHAGAIAALDRAIAVESPGNNGWLHYLRSTFRKQQGDDAGARRDMAIALERGYPVRDPAERAALVEYARGAGSAAAPAAEAGAGAG